MLTQEPQYGRVERLYIDQDARQVFIKFTDQVSALRVSVSSHSGAAVRTCADGAAHQAVNELDGRVFNGNAIAPRFYNAEKFERGNYTSA